MRSLGCDGNSVQVGTNTDIHNTRYDKSGGWRGNIDDERVSDRCGGNPRKVLREQVQSMDNSVIGLPLLQHTNAQIELSTKTSNHICSNLKAMLRLCRRHNAMLKTSQSSFSKLKCSHQIILLLVRIQQLFLSSWLAQQSRNLLQRSERWNDGSNRTWKTWTRVK